VGVCKKFCSRKEVSKLAKDTGPNPFTNQFDNKFIKLKFAFYKFPFSFFKESSYLGLIFAP
jgi:hypothetical protein